MGSTVPPPDHVLRSLAKANSVRSARAALLNRVRKAPPRQSCELVADMLEDPPEVIESMFLTELLYEVRRMQDGQPEQMLVRVGVDSVVSVRELTPRQRFALADELRLRARRAATRDDQCAR